MLQVGRDLDLGQEPLDAEHRAQLGIQDLERDLAVVAHVAGEVDGRHPAATDLAVNGVAVLQCGGEGGEHQAGPKLPPEGQRRQPSVQEPGRGLLRGRFRSGCHRSIHG